MQNNDHHGCTVGWMDNEFIKSFKFYAILNLFNN